MGVLNEPVLELLAAQSFFETSALPNAPLALRLMPGECALIEAQDADRVAAFADLCSGMVAVRDGAVRCMGHDWTTLDSERSGALRGRIGRIHHKGAWPDMLPTHASIMLGQLHHTRDAEAEIARSAIALARLLGLPGLPLARPGQLSEGDLIRAAAVRAFLGAPHLLLLETGIDAQHPELTTPLLDLLVRALDRGAAAICFTRDPDYWQAQGLRVSHRLLLQEDGLFAVGGG